MNLLELAIMADRLTDSISHLSADSEKKGNADTAGSEITRRRPGGCTWRYVAQGGGGGKRGRLEISLGKAGESRRGNDNHDHGQKCREND